MVILDNNKTPGAWYPRQLTLPGLAQVEGIRDESLISCTYIGKYIMRFDEFNLTNLQEGINDPGIFKAIFMAGPPGAGKNLIIDQLGLKAAGLKLQDSDHVLAYLNKAKQVAKQAERLPYDDSGYEHSRRTIRKRQTVLQQEMLGLIINTTGRDYEALMLLKRELESVGYQTFMIFVDADMKLAWERAKDRQANATDPKDRNRPVDIRYFVRAYRDTKKNLEFYSLMFGENFVLIENNTPFNPVDTIKQPSNITKKSVGAQIRSALGKVRKFLAMPLTPIAKEAVNAAKQKRGLESRTS